MKLRVITTNVISGERVVHGDYSSISSAVEASEKLNNRACTHTLIFDVETGREVILIGLETGSNTALHRSREIRKTIDTRM